MQPKSRLPTTAPCWRCAANGWTTLPTASSIAGGFPTPWPLSFHSRTARRRRWAAPGLPALVCVLCFRQGRWLAVPPATDHELKLRGPAGQVTAAPPAEIVAGLAAVPLDNCAGGSLTVGQLVVMFQWVRPDAVPVVTVRKPMLRMGLVCDDRLLAEQVHQTGTTLSVGGQRSDTLVLPDVDYCGAPVRFSKGKSSDRVRVSVPIGCGLRLAKELSRNYPINFGSSGAASRLSGRELATHPASANCPT